MDEDVNCWHQEKHSTIGRFTLVELTIASIIRALLSKIKQNLFHAEFHNVAGNACVQHFQVRQPKGLRDFYMWTFCHSVII